MYLFDKVTISAPVIDEKILSMGKISTMDMHAWKSYTDVEENSTWSKADPEWNRKADATKISLSLVRVS